MSDSELKIDDAVNHVSIKVKNLAESVKFYHETMGLPIIRQLGPADNPRTVFLPGVELSQLPEGQSSEVPGCLAHIGIAVDNIEEACKRLEEHGVEFETPLREIVFEEIQQRLQLAFFRDPDGIMVEYVKWTPM
jgi:catechol 2,3-dioxygenase-like lactoylglutathione lyase family enzyme